MQTSTILEVRRCFVRIDYSAGFCVRLKLWSWIWLMIQISRDWSLKNNWQFFMDGEWVGSLGVTRRRSFRILLRLWWCYRMMRFCIMMWLHLELMDCCFHSKEEGSMSMLLIQKSKKVGCDYVTSTLLPRDVHARSSRFDGSTRLSFGFDGRMSYQNSQKIRSHYVYHRACTSRPNPGQHNKQQGLSHWGALV